MLTQITDARILKPGCDVQVIRAKVC